MGATDALALPFPELTQTADGPDAFSDLANAVEDYFYDRILPAGVTRAPSYHWGSGTNPPLAATPGLRNGDTFFHSGQNTLLSFNGTDWRQAAFPAPGADSAPLFTDQIRYHPTLGLQRGGADGTWKTPNLDHAMFFGVSNNTSGTVAANTWYAPSLGGVEVIDSHNGHAPSDNRYIVPAGQGGLWEVSGHVAYVGLGNPARFATSIHVNGVIVPGFGHGAYIESVAGGSGIMFTGTKLLNLVAGDIVAVMGRGSTIWQAWTDAANAISAAQLLCKRLRAA